MNLEHSAPDGIQDKLQPLRDGHFRFECHPGVPCFTECCRALNLLLTPYDILRLKNHLGLTSSEFLDRYVSLRPEAETGLPLAFLEMQDDERQTCPFVAAAGCRVYPARPAACRTYPLARASRKHALHGMVLEQYYVLREDHCRGFEETREFTTDQWVADQGLESYHESNNLWMEIITNRLLKQKPLSAQQMQMVYLAAYDLDRFREFVFASRFLDRFEVATEDLEAAKQNDEGLLRLAFHWLRFTLFRHATLKLREVPEPPCGRS